MTLPVRLWLISRRCNISLKKTLHRLISIHEALYCRNTSLLQVWPNFRFSIPFQKRRNIWKLRDASSVGSIGCMNIFCYEKNLYSPETGSEKNEKKNLTILTIHQNHIPNSPQIPKCRAILSQCLYLHKNFSLLFSIISLGNGKLFRCTITTKY